MLKNYTANPFSYHYTASLQIKCWLHSYITVIMGTTTQIHFKYMQNQDKNRLAVVKVMQMPDAALAILLCEESNHGKVSGKTVRLVSRC
jgi:hypothetical protein